jgi:DNA transposition AAA+ family ATPase
MNTKENLSRLMARKHYSQSKVAAKTGLSTAVISQYINGKYTGSISAVEHAINEFISREEEKERNRTVRVGYVPTRLAKRCIEIMRNTQLDGDIGVIYGSAGLGKTMAMREYASRDQSAILIEADPGFTTKVLLEELCIKLGVNKRGNIHELSENCINALRDTGKAILIDEAELLPYRALEVLRRIHDRTGVGIVLAGMPRLLLNLKGRRGEYAQLYSRVGMALDLDANLKRADFDDILANMLPEDDDGEVNVEAPLLDAFYKGAKGNYRRLFKLARGVVRAGQIDNQGISVKLVEEYSKMLIN